ncbi:MAG: hypothetical protein K2H12_12660, partial [Acetatifactor sp.]|nr:hypothetical protein [Acetatifactor sp.]
NTEITLPAQGKKEFSLTVPGRAVDSIKAECVLNFLDSSGNLVQSIPLKDLLYQMSGVSVGILSDDYSALTYMDAGGGSLYIRGDTYPFYLMQLNWDNLRTYLDGLHFLVIDQFNVSVLEEEDIRAIQQWVQDGGWLLVGTGAYVEQTLSGFDEDFLDIQVAGILEPTEENVFSENQNIYGWYSQYSNYGDEDAVDFSQMTFAQLDYQSGGFSESRDHPAIYRPIGEGAAAVYFCSMGDEQMQKLHGYTVEDMYEELMRQSSSWRSLQSSTSMEYAGQRVLAFIGNSDTDVDLSLLKLLIGIYVVLAGPVLYLILRKCKKSEWYWVGVPTLGLAFILGVFLLGRGVRVNEAKVYSVTVQKADEERIDTYFLAYHSGTKPWEMRLRDDYEVTGVELDTLVEEAWKVEGV